MMRETKKENNFQDRNFYKKCVIFKCLQNLFKVFCGFKLIYTCTQKKYVASEENLQVSIYLLFAGGF